MRNYIMAGSEHKAFTIRPELIFIKRAELLVSQQREWCETEQRKTPLAVRIKSTLIPEICKNTLVSLREARTRLLLVISGLAGRHQGEEFEHLVRYLVIMGNRKGFPRLRNTRRALPDWDETSRYDKTIMVADASMGLQGYETHHVTLNMSDSVRDTYRKQQKPLEWMRARLNRNLNAIADKVGQETPIMLLTEETTENEFEHFHFLLVHKGLKKKHIKHALKRAAGQDYHYVRGKAQSVMKSISTQKDAIRVCNYMMKQDHSYYLNRKLARMAKVRYEYYKQLLNDINDSLATEHSIQPTVSNSKTNNSSKGKLANLNSENTPCEPDKPSASGTLIEELPGHLAEPIVLEKNASLMGSRDRVRDEISKFRSNECFECTQPDNRISTPVQCNTERAS